MSESVLSSIIAGRPLNYNALTQLGALQLIDLNLTYIVKEQVLPLNGYVTRMTEVINPGTQSIDPITGLTVTPYQSTYYDWVYYNPDNTNPALTGLLTVPTVSNSGSLAYFDYPNGAVYFSGIQSHPITVTYDYYSVYVQDGFPDWGADIKETAAMRLPIVSLEFSARSSIPFAIGGTFQKERRFVFDILAASDAQRDDISDTIESSLKYQYTNTINYSYGFPILSNGDRNLKFDRGIASRWKPFRFTHVTSRIIHAPMAGEKYRHRSQISFTIKNLEDGN